MQEEAYFTSVGNLYVTLIEGLDLFAPNQAKSLWVRKVRQTRSSYAQISIYDGTNHSWVSEQHRTAVVPYNGNEVFSFGEDFTFENVPSTCFIVLAIYALSRSQGQSSSRCLGEVKIPLSRLEENNVVRCRWLTVATIVSLSALMSFWWYVGNTMVSVARSRLWRSIKGCSSHEGKSTTFVWS